MKRCEANDGRGIMISVRLADRVGELHSLVFVCASTQHLCENGGVDGEMGL